MKQLDLTKKEKLKSKKLDPYKIIHLKHWFGLPGSYWNKKLLIQLSNEMLSTYKSKTKKTNME